MQEAQPFGPYNPADPVFLELSMVGKMPCGIYGKPLQESLSVDLWSSGVRSCYLQWEMIHLLKTTPGITQFPD